MALVKLTEYGYGQLELNLVAFPRTGRVVAQYKAGDSFIGAEEKDNKPLENGMLLMVDGAKRCVEMKAPVKGEANVYALNYSTEHMYDERVYRLADYKLNPVNDFYPRLGYLDMGDKFTTNTVCYDTGEATKTVADIWAELKETFAAGTAIYGGACENGYIQLSTAMPTEGPALRVIEIYTMPDGQTAVKLEVIRG